jgi:hypothetical protein
MAKPFVAEASPHQTAIVMPGLVPSIHDFSCTWQPKDVDGRDKPGHDEK